MAAHPLAAELRRIRQERGISQQAIADRLGKHRNTIVFWENGTRRMGPAELCAYAAALGYEITLQPQAKEQAA